MLGAGDVTVVNMSFTGPANILLEQTINRFLESEIIIVAAAGNEGAQSLPAYPGAYKNVIAITAVDRNSQVYRRVGRGDHVDFAAPGVEVWTAASIRGARNQTGTSFAVPFITAAVALIQNELEITDYEEILSILSGSAIDLGEEGRDETYGFGLVQAGEFCG